MLTNECTHLTPAQAALLDFASHIEADNLYRQLHTTLGVSMGNYISPEDRDDPRAAPTPKMLEAWYFTLEIMLHLHGVAVEDREERKIFNDKQS